MLNDITPVLLSYNEAPNIARTLSNLAWAKDIVVVDSFSDDGTLAILKACPQVRLFKRAFDSHGKQWRFAVEETMIATPWVLRLDADYQLPPELIEELAGLNPDPAVSAYRIGFDYAVFSRGLVSSLYPSNTILLRRGQFSVADDGHTEKWTVDGLVKTLKARVVHDDWKPAERWLRAQCHYIPREFDKVRERPVGLRDWLRLSPPIMPFAAFLYCLFGKGLILNGRAGLHYALQRMVAEAILSLMVLEKKLIEPVPRPGGKASGRPVQEERDA